MLKRVLIGTLMGAALGLIGFFLAQHPSTHAMGTVMFVLVPFGAGFSISVVAGNARAVTASAWISLIFVLVCLIAGGREGFLCAILAFPLLFLALLVGAFLGWVVRYEVVRRKPETTSFSAVVVVLITPALILGARMMENPQVRSEGVESAIELRAEPEQVWSMIQSLDSVKANKPWLMYVGLPIPVSCRMEGRGVG